MRGMKPLLVLDVVGLTPALLAHTPRLAALARAGFQTALGTVLPAVTCSAQATMLTGRLPRDHGIVGNGWYVRDLAEVMLWRQSNALVGCEQEKLWHVAGAGSAPASPWRRCFGGTTCTRRSTRP
jgi:predicted AlkP superfamily pyrophosphatase or phosphodiesterase